MCSNCVKRDRNFLAYCSPQQNVFCTLCHCITNSNGETIKFLSIYGSINYLSRLFPFHLNTHTDSPSPNTTSNEK